MTEPRFADRFLEALSSHDGSRVAALMAEDGVYEDVALGAVHEGRDAVKGFIAELAAMSSDSRFSAVGVQQDGRSYCIEWECTGTHDGDTPLLPATNQAYVTRGVSVGELDDTGLIRRNRDYWDMAGFLVQLGILPPLG